MLAKNLPRLRVTQYKVGILYMYKKKIKVQ